MLPTAPTRSRRERRRESGPPRIRERRGRRRTLLFACITLAAAIAAVGIYDLILRQVSGHTVADTQISHLPTAGADAQPVFVGHPAVAGAPVPGQTQSGKQKHRGAGPPMPTDVPGNWKLVFDDEFNGVGLDTSKWSMGWLSSGITGPVNHKESECYDPSQVAVDSGSLNLTIVAKSESCGINDPRYATGLVNTAGKFSYTYGLLEARVWLPPANGAPDKVANWPSVWTDGQNWPYDGEDDVVEGLAGQACAHFHSAAETSGVGPAGGSGCPGGQYAGGWHTFAANWQPGSVTYYYDGLDIGSVTQGVTSAPMFIVLSYDAGRAYPKAPATMKVDYVRVWKHT